MSPGMRSSFSINVGWAAGVEATAVGVVVAMLSEGTLNDSRDKYAKYSKRESGCHALSRCLLRQYSLESKQRSIATAEGLLTSTFTCLYQLATSWLPIIRVLAGRLVMITL